MMDAFFLAILQVLVYAGAVMVLFLFIIMLLDMDESEDLRTRAIPSMAAMVLGGLILVTILGFFSGKFDDQFPEIQEPAALKLDGSQTLPEVYEKHLPLPYGTKAKTLVRSLHQIYASISGHWSAPSHRNGGSDCPQ